MLEGTLEHIVNGESHMLEPGMVGFVRRLRMRSNTRPDLPAR